MKIKEVMTATGLTEKTIRYYEERALITPETYRQNGRTYHEYSKEDVAALKHIVSLRQAQFTLEEIRRMQQDAGTIPEILSDHHKRIAAQRESLEALADLSESEAKSWDALAQELTDRYRRTPDYQPTLRFAEFDPESEAQREAELRKVRQRHSHSVSPSKIAIISLSIVCAALLALVIILLARAGSAVSVSNDATADWHYYVTKEGLMRTKDWDKEGQLVFGRDTIDTTISYRLGPDKVYVLSDEKLYSMNPDGSGLHSFKAKYASAYVCGEDSSGYSVPFFLVGEDLIVEECSSGAFGGTETVLVRVPLDGKPQQKLEIDLESGYSYQPLVEGNMLYLFRKESFAREEGTACTVILYDLVEDRVVDMLDGPSYSNFQNSLNTWHDGWYLSATHYDSWGNGDDYSFSITTEVMLLSPENLTGTLADTVEGEPVTIWGNYMVYRGDYQVFYEQPDPLIEDPIPYSESTAYYLRNLDTGTEVKLSIAPHTAFHLNFYEEGLLITGSKYEKTWVAYP